jgi:hypothetical protein
MWSAPSTTRSSLEVVWAPRRYYVRKRVDAGRIEIGAARTLFARAHVKGQPDTRSVRIEVVREFDTTMLVVRDTTPPPIPSGLSEDERWHKAGVVRGKPFDPNAL